MGFGGEDAGADDGCGGVAASQSGAAGAVGQPVAVGGGAVRRLRPSSCYQLTAADWIGCRAGRGQPPDRPS